MSYHKFVSDDSGIHSSNPESPLVLGAAGDVDPKGVFVGNRGDVTRRPIRKLPTLPSAKQAHIVNLTSLTRGASSNENNRKSMRTLPSLPLFGGGGSNNSSPAKQSGTGSATNWIKSVRLSNFFRSVKFSRYSYSCKFY